MTHPPLLRPDGRFDRSAIMSDAHDQYRRTRALGWSWSRCLSFSWARARAMRDAETMRKAA